MSDKIELTKKQYAEIFKHAVLENSIDGEIDIMVEPTLNN